MSGAMLDSPADMTGDAGEHITKDITKDITQKSCQETLNDTGGTVKEGVDAVAEGAALAALLRCCLREVAAPRGQVWASGAYLSLRLAGSLIRVPASGGCALRFDGPAERLERGAWRPLSVDRLLGLVETELNGAEPGGPDRGEAGDGRARNEEFAGQVTGSREAIAVLLRARASARPPGDAWLASEQALVFGHPFHPSPKARGGPGWERYAPEAHAAFPLRLLGVRDDLLASGGDPRAMDALGESPPGYTLLPAHPWQLELLGAELAAPFADGLLVDLGEGSGLAVPTSSVRTVYEPQIGKCLKFSINVRITNCVRKNAWYELAAAAELSRRLEPVFADLAGRFPGTRWLPEPGYRSASLGTRLFEGLGVILRTGPWEVTGPGITPILAGALAAPGHGTGLPPAGEGTRDPGGPAGPGVSPTGTGLVAADGRPGTGGRQDAGGPSGGVAAAMRRDPVGWWGAYVDHVALPVLDAYFRHGVVLEPHLQNVLVGINAEGMPVAAIFRDLEGTKLVTGRHDVTGLPDPVARAATYDAARGWDRVVYCIMVNHLPEIAATVARTATSRAEDELLRAMWADARSRFAGYAAENDRPLALSDLLAGVPLPAKANLSARWSRSADRDTRYVPVANPFAGVPA